MDGEVLVMDGRGSRIEQARKQAGLDQTSLAGKLGVGTKTIYNWEHELTEPTPENWARLALELGRTVRWFQEGDQENEYQAKIKELEARIESLERRLK